MTVDFGGRRRPSGKRVVLIVAGGMLLGALLTELMALALPASAAREFFVTTVAASLGPLTIDLLVVAMTVGPLVIRLNILSVVGILLLAWFAKSLL
ncbi:MAG: hypothetical protein Q8W46_05785 [Candidatus Palauibacterales bacterium]|jgi:hypothetical protein|nr:hypothetical protein [Candidatus Palauibacterales bacterium]